MYATPPSSPSLSSQPLLRRPSLPTPNLLAPPSLCSSCLPPSPSAGPQQQHGKALSLSAKERRRLKHERREQLLEARPAWREEADKRLVEEMRMKKKAGRRKDIGHLSMKGPRWWMLFAPRYAEARTAQEVSNALSHGFPDRHFQVIVPTVPSKRRLKNGKFCNSRLVLHPGCIFLHCIMDRQVYDVARAIPGVQGFFGSKIGYFMQVVVPTPLPKDQMEGVFRKVQEEENDFERLIAESEANKRTSHDREENISTAVETYAVDVGCKV